MFSGSPEMGQLSLFKLVFIYIFYINDSHSCSLRNFHNIFMQNF